jgi:hypothetical protein
MAVTYDFGKCASCGDTNSKSIQMCRSCGAPLPWAKQQSARSGSVDIGSKIGVSDIAYGAIATWIVGGLVCLGGAFLWLGNVLGFFPTVPMVGYITICIGAAICRFAATMDS